MRSSSPYMFLPPTNQSPDSILFLVTSLVLLASIFYLPGHIAFVAHRAAYYFFGTWHSWHSLVDSLAAWAPSSEAADWLRSTVAANVPKDGPPGMPAPAAPVVRVGKERGAGNLADRAAEAVAAAEGLAGGTL